MIPGNQWAEYLRLLRFDFAAMGHEVAHAGILRSTELRGLVLRPLLSAHITHSVKMRAFLDHDHRALDIADENPRLLNLDLLKLP
jgi:hypothetical protein